MGEQAHAQELRGCAVPPAEPHLEGRAAGNRWRVSEAVGIGEVHGQAQHVLAHRRDMLKGDLGEDKHAYVNLFTNGWGFCLGMLSFNGGTFGTGRERISRIHEQAMPGNPADRQEAAGPWGAEGHPPETRTVALGRRLETVRSAAWLG